MTTFFAECLPRLGIINLQLSLDHPSTNSTVFHTTSNSTTCLLHHNNHETLIRLPRKATKSDTIPFPRDRTVVTARIPCIPAKDTNEVPWTVLSAEDVANCGNRNAGVYCAKCGREVVGGEKILRWKELPSDSWVEYSDYWLCHANASTDSHSHSHGHGHGHSHSRSHKHPTHHNSQPRQLPIITSIQGTGLIGLTSLLFHPNDLQSPQNVLPHSLLFPPVPI